MKISDDVREKVSLLWGDFPPTMIQKLGIEFTVLSKSLVCGTMPVDERTKQPFGLLHGGASVALAESLASIGAWLNLEKGHAVGLEINANHLKSVKSGVVEGTAIPLHLGRSTQVWDIRITDSAGILICVSRLTLAIISEKPNIGTQELGK